MRLPLLLLAAVLTLSAHQVPVTAFVGSAAASTGLKSPRFLHPVGTDQSASNQSRFLRGNNIAEGDKEERAFVDVEKVMAKNLVDKMARTNSFSVLDNVDDLARIDKISAAADDFLTSAFKIADNAKMSPSALANDLKTFRELDDDFIEKAVGMYTNYLKGLGK
ncbi:Secreted RxLR effector peptide protein [Phytophthora palmivora]|uniref:RxLR effector protein n=1 Tax=Phytophthora palmivora TaxID=4796 RepID=A0A2P4XU62_9STRA|nr:Secreted RxLR effector peptide protein [Phytophthora palmivora]